VPEADVTARGAASSDADEAGAAIPMIGDRRRSLE
jgi:hypothetical protein